MTDIERLNFIYAALQERGYAPISQIVGFLLSGDPTYITNHNGARAIAGQINRSEILTEIVGDYISHHCHSQTQLIEKYRKSPVSK